MSRMGAGVSIVDSLVDNDDLDQYYVHLRKGELYDFSLTGDSNGSAAYIHNPSLIVSGNNQTATNDDGGAGLNATVRFVPAASGNYLVTVDGLGADGAGFYKLVVTATGFEYDILDHPGAWLQVGADTRLAVGDTLVSEISHEHDADLVWVSLQAGEDYSIDVRGTASGDGTLDDPTLTLLDNDGQQLAFNDDGGIGPNAHLSFTPLTSGAYALKVDGWDDHTGTYELQVSAPHGDVVPGTIATGFNVPLDGAVQGTVDSSDDLDMYAVRLVSGENYRFELKSAANGGDALPDPFLSLYSFAGTLIAANTGAGGVAVLIFNAGVDAVHYLRATSLGAGTGNYDLSATLISLPPYPLLAVASNEGAGSNAVIEGSDGSDNLTGGGGNDRIDGNLGDDLIDGGGGNDTLYGGEGLNGLTGGAGDDTFRIDAGDSVNESAGGGIDTVETAMSYTLGANVENLTLTRVFHVSGAGNGLDNSIMGNTGANLLSGGAGADTLNGGQGDDTLVGGAGKDLLTGSGGLDQIRYGALSDSGVVFAQRDAVNSFAHGDKIDLGALDANASIGGNQAFSFVTSFTGVAGQLQWDQTGANAFLMYGDTNGDAAADFSLQIYGVAGFGQVQSWDFVL
jgi:Ca2+-binding RTX toxin-like protein